MTLDKLSPLSLYIHIPFCRSKCGYCDFISYGGLEDIIPTYIDALSNELRMRALGNRQSVATIYFGGGTPSLLNTTQIGKMIDTCRKYFQMEKNAELTLEANPGSTTPQWLSTIRDIGFNRLSLGFQSLGDNDLRLLGRIHSAGQALEAYTWARQAGFENINIDLIYGLPAQTLKQWQRILSSALSLAPEHLSLYPLTLEEATPLGQAVESGSIPAPDPDMAAEMYQYAEESLSGVGYEHYELSNWSLPGNACRHNLTYWENRPYLGLGAGAHSFINGYRVANSARPEEYISNLESGKLPQAEKEFINPALELSETIILGLRLVNGIELNDIKLRFGIDMSVIYQSEIDELKESGLLERDVSTLRLTQRGRLLGNEVFWRFLPKETS